MRLRQLWRSGLIRYRVSCREGLVEEADDRHALRSMFGRGLEHVLVGRRGEESQTSLV